MQLANNKYFMTYDDDGGHGSSSKDESDSSSIISSSSSKFEMDPDLNLKLDINTNELHSYFHSLIDGLRDATTRLDSMLDLL